jgi:putative ABC transport system permease protein
LTVRRPATQRAEGDPATRTVRFLLTSFSSLTVVVALFLLYNAVSMTVAQQGREIALMRVLGVRGKQVISLFLFEAALIGGAGALLGFVFGVSLARLLLGPLSRTLGGALSLDPTAAPDVTVGPLTLGIAASLGVATALLAAWLPARQATRFVPVVLRGKVPWSRFARPGCPRAGGDSSASVSRRWWPGRPCPRRRAARPGG